MERLRERVPEPQILLVPGHFLFGRRFATPPELPATEAHALLELSVEGVSPFPVEQLAWGYLRPPGTQETFCYATSQGRLRQLLGELDIHGFYFAFPGFLTQFGVTFDRPTVRFLSQNGAVSALLYEANDPQPKQVFSRPITGGLLSHEATLATRDALLASLPKGLNAKIEDGVWIGDGYTLDERGRPHFSHQHVTSRGVIATDSHTLAHSSSVLWRADLREDAFKAKEQRARTVSGRLWRAIQVIGVAALLMLLLQFSHWGLNAWQTLRLSEISRQAPAAQRINESMLLAARVSEAVERSLQPIRMLEIVNEVRPDPIHFTRTRSSTYNELYVEGESSQGIPTVNTFVGALERLPAVRSVAQSSETVAGRTRFEMTITFADAALIPLERARVEDDSPTTAQR